MNEIFSSFLDFFKIPISLENLIFTKLSNLSDINGLLLQQSFNIPFWVSLIFGISYIKNQRKWEKSLMQVFSGLALLYVFITYFL